VPPDRRCNEASRQPLLWWGDRLREVSVVNRRTFVAAVAALFGTGRVPSARAEALREAKLHVEGMY